MKCNASAAKLQRLLGSINLKLKVSASHNIKEARQHVFLWSSKEPDHPRITMHKILRTGRWAPCLQPQRPGNSSPKPTVGRFVLGGCEGDETMRPRARGPHNGRSHAHTSIDPSSPCAIGNLTFTTPTGEGQETPAGVQSRPIDGRPYRPPTPPQPYKLSGFG